MNVWNRQLAGLAIALLLNACGNMTAAVTPTTSPTREPTTPPTSTHPATVTPTRTAAPIPTATPTPLYRANGLPVFSHIFIIVMENKEAVSIVGNPSAPYINELAAQYARANQFYGIRHPSLPNYLALIGGDTFGVDTNCTHCFVDADNLASQLETAGRSWKAYIESMPSPCFVGDAPPLYAQKHNPFIYFDNIRNDPARCGKIVPFDQFAADLQTNTLPDFVWITPDMCSSTHDCSVKTGDDWLAQWAPQILSLPAWQDRGVLFITFDEGGTDDGCCEYAAGGRVDTLVISPLVKPGFASNAPYDHYSLLRTIEESWGLPLLGKANCGCTAAMADFFTQP